MGGVVLPEGRGGTPGRGHGAAGAVPLGRLLAPRYVPVLSPTVAARGAPVRRDRDRPARRREARRDCGRPSRRLRPSALTMARLRVAIDARRFQDVPLGGVGRSIAGML